MVLEFEIPSAFDPFADAKQSGTKEYVHIRIQQRNGKKSLTTVQGLPKELSYEKILKTLKKDFCCNGNVVQDKELGKVIQLQGDQRKNVQNFLVNQNIVKKDQIKIHGFWINLVFTTSKLLIKLLCVCLIFFSPLCRWIVVIVTTVMRVFSFNNNNSNSFLNFCVRVEQSVISPFAVRKVCVVLELRVL